MLRCLQKASDSTVGSSWLAAGSVSVRWEQLCVGKTEVGARRGECVPSTQQSLAALIHHQTASRCLFYVFLYFNKPTVVGLNPLCYYGACKWCWRCFKWYIFLLSVLRNILVWCGSWIYQVSIQLCLAQPFKSVQDVSGLGEEAEVSRERT